MDRVVWIRAPADVSAFWLLWVVLQRMWECGCGLEILMSFPVDIDPAVGLLDRRAALFYTGGNCPPLRLDGLPFAPPGSWGLLFPPSSPTPTLDFFLPAALAGARWSRCGLICVSLVISDTGRLCTVLLAICMPSLEKRPFPLPILCLGCLAFVVELEDLCRSTLGAHRGPPADARSLLVHGGAS